VVSTIDTNGGFKTFRYENCLKKGMHRRRRTQTTIAKDVISTLIFNGIVALISFWVISVSLDMGKMLKFGLFFHSGYERENDAGNFCLKLSFVWA
jgi:hypothetical protein